MFSEQELLEDETSLVGKTFQEKANIRLSKTGGLVNKRFLLQACESNRIKDLFPNASRCRCKMSFGSSKKPS